MRWTLAVSFILVSLAFSCAALADIPNDPSHGWLTGAIEPAGESQARVQGILVSATSETVVKGLNPDGTVTDLAFADLLAGDLVHVHSLNAAEGAVATHIFRGVYFFLRGTVTEITLDADGHPVSIVLDGLFSIFTHGPHVRAASASSITADPSPLLGGDEGGNQPGLIQVGSSVGVGGISDSGVFTALFVHVLAGDRHVTGRISSLMKDDSGRVVGFAMQRGDQSANVVLDEATRIRDKGGPPLPPAALREGMKVRVDGLALADGSILAQFVIVIRHH